MHWTGITMLKKAAGEAGRFFSSPFNRFLSLLVICLALYAWAFSPVPTPVAPQQFFGGNATIEAHFFYHPACPHCKEQMGTNQLLAEEFGSVKWVYHDVSKEDENALFGRMLGGLGKEKGGVPTTVINSSVIVGFDSFSTPDKLRSAILLAGGAQQQEQEGNGGMEIAVPLLGTLDVSGYSLPALAVTLGIIDGFNPCAMWVLVYLISITLTLQDRKRLALVVLTFLIASGVLYFLIMAAWLNAFLFVGYLRPVMVIVGALAIGGGALSLKEFWESKGKISCKVGDVKEKGKISKGIEKLLFAPLTWATFAGLVALAFTVNSIEFICSSAIPAVFTQVLALQIIPAWQHYAYISLYVIFYMLDDAIVFGLAFLAVGGTLGDRIASYGHAIGAAILIVLGLLLLFVPGMLVSA